jgi:hypothetical protein
MQLGHLFTMLLDMILFFWEFAECAVRYLGSGFFFLPFGSEWSDLALFCDLISGQAISVGCV